MSKVGSPLLFDWRGPSPLRSGVLVVVRSWTREVTVAGKPVLLRIADLLA